VTRLVEFSLVGRFFPLKFFKYKKVAKFCGLLFSFGKRFVLILTKINWAAFRLTFYQTHLATLLKARFLDMFLPPCRIITHTESRHGSARYGLFILCKEHQALAPLSHIATVKFRKIKKNPYMYISIYVRFLFITLT
jgi:hypothetical protein